MNEGEHNTSRDDFEAAIARSRAELRALIERSQATIEDARRVLADLERQRVERDAKRARTEHGRDESACT